MALPFSHFSLYALILITSFLLSCKKEQAGLEILKIETGTVMDITDIVTAGNDTIYLTGNGGNQGIVLRSTDAGATWTTLKEFGYGINAIAVSDNYIYAAGDSFNIFYSPDAGMNWQELWLTYTPSLEYQTHLKDIFIFSGKVYFCGGWNFGKGVTGYTGDGGASWKYTTSEHELSSIYMFDELRGICQGYGAILLTFDGGNSWIPYDAQDEYWTALDSRADILLSCSYSGTIRRSTDKGVSWKTLSSTGKALQKGIMAIDASPEGEAISVGLNGKGYYSGDGTNWKAIKGFEGNHIYCIKLTGQKTGLAAGEKGCLYRFRVN